MKPPPVLAAACPCTREGSRGNFKIYSNSTRRASQDKPSSMQHPSHKRRHHVKTPKTRSKLRGAGSSFTFANLIPKRHKSTWEAQSKHPHPKTLNSLLCKDAPPPHSLAITNNSSQTIQRIPTITQCTQVQKLHLFLSVSVSFRTLPTSI